MRKMMKMAKFAILRIWAWFRKEVRRVWLVVKSIVGGDSESLKAVIRYFLYKLVQNINSLIKILTFFNVCKWFFG